MGVVGIALAGVLKVFGGASEAINDVFAVCGYGGIALLIYSFGLKNINGAIGWISGISYEWYLVHMLILSAATNVFKDSLTITVIAVPVSLFIVWIYKKVFDRFYALKLKN